MDILKIILRNLFFFVRNAVIFAVVACIMIVTPVAIKTGSFWDEFAMGIIFGRCLYWAVMYNTPFLFVLCLFGICREFYTSWKFCLLESFIHMSLFWLLTCFVSFSWKSALVAYVITFLIMLAISYFRTRYLMRKKSVEGISA